MEILFLISVLVFVAIYAAYREWLNAAHRRWLGELDLYKKRLSAYEELKRAVGPLRAAGQVSQDDADRFARTMSDMRFLFDKEFDLFVGALHGALVKKHALDALLEKAANYAHSPEDQALTDTAKRRSRELASQITEAIDRKEVSPNSANRLAAQALGPAPKNETTARAAISFSWCARRSVSRWSEVSRCHSAPSRCSGPLSTPA